MKCRFQGEGIPDGAIYLGRPWREFAKTVLLHCELGAHIRPEGWHDWNKPCFPATGYYAEFASTGAGSQGQRAAYVHRLTAEEGKSTRSSGSGGLFRRKGDIDSIIRKTPQARCFQPMSAANFIYPDT